MSKPYELIGVRVWAGFPDGAIIPPNAIPVPGVDILYTLEKRSRLVDRKHEKRAGVVSDPE